MNRIICCFMVAAMTTTAAFAQSGSDSPYSQFGLGDLADQSTGFNKGMNGVGLAMRKGNEVNPMNPASYAAVDSISMIFDAGLSGQITNFQENNIKKSAKSGGFDYVMGMFRLIKNVGVTVGVMPYSNIGYSYSSSTTLTDVGTTVTSKYSGTGGLNQVFIGTGFKVVGPLSVGMNVSYLWGDIRRGVSTSGSTAINTLSKLYEASISSYKLDFGLQYVQKLGEIDALTLGATYSPGHHLNTDPACEITSINAAISKSDTTRFSISNGLSIPTTYGVGLAYNHGSMFRVGADLHVQKWGSVDYPSYENGNYALKSGLLKDSYKVNVGAEWIPNPMGRKLLDHVRYRVGAGYSTPYYYINGKEGPKSYGVSLGFGIPIANAYNNRSILNISAQWQRRSADNLIKENVFRINIGLTFNERWFAKWKID